MPNHILYITHELVSTVRIQVLHFSHQFDIKARIIHQQKSGIKQEHRRKHVTNVSLRKKKQ